MSLTNPTEETIAAIASAVSPGEGAIAIVKVSGPLAKKVVSTIVRIPGKQEWKSHSILYGYVINQKTKKKIDEVLILIMDGPRSFTGEDVVEIHCHGGLIAVQATLEQILIQPNTRRAFPGEFSQRAVLNGRLDITQAEAIHELISARTQKAAQLAMAGMDGDISNVIKKIKNQLIDQLSEIEARIDFEEDLPALNSKTLFADLMLIRDQLNQLISDAKQGCLIRNGLKVALIGSPNVGKSSLLNFFSKKEKAIVTNMPGTTRDLLESDVILKGIPITLLDTAGIRETNDAIEKIGVSRSHKALLTADVVVQIFDVSQGWTTNDQKLLKQIPTDTPKLIVGNKSDLPSQDSGSIANATMSALTGEGENEVIMKLLKICGANTTSGVEIALNQRQLDLVKDAVNAIDQIAEVATQHLPWDFWTIDLREAIYKLNEVTGEELTEVLLDRIFARFCIGK